MSFTCVGWHWEMTFVKIFFLCLVYNFMRVTYLLFCRNFINVSYNIIKRNKQWKLLFLDGEICILKLIYSDRILQKVVRKLAMIYFRKAVLLIFPFLLKLGRHDVPTYCIWFTSTSGRENSVRWEFFPCSVRKINYFNQTVLPLLMSVFQRINLNKTETRVKNKFETFCKHFNAISVSVLLCFWTKMWWKS